VYVPCVCFICGLNVWASIRDSAFIRGRRLFETRVSLEVLRYSILFTFALSTMPHLVSGMNFPKNFANLSMMGPCHCHLIFLSPVHHYHHHYHHFCYASLHLCSTPDSKLTFSVNPSHHNLPHQGLEEPRFFRESF